jgi:hypothetical protein
MSAHPHRRTDINMTTDERRSYMRWWLERSGLTPDQVREVATGIWSDRLVDGTHGSFDAREGAPSRQTTLAFVFRSATGSEASDIAGDPQA